MQYLVAIPGDGAYEEEALEAGEPVVPAFCMGACNHFIGVKADGRVSTARVVEFTEDPDELLKLFCAQYPGLPKKMLEDVLFNVVKVASALDKLDRFRVFVQPHSATLQSTIDEELVPIWEDMDTTKYL